MLASWWKIFSFLRIIASPRSMLPNACQKQAFRSLGVCVRAWQTWQVEIHLKWAHLRVGVLYLHVCNVHFYARLLHWMPWLANFFNSSLRRDRGFEACVNTGTFSRSAEVLFYRQMRSWVTEYKTYIWLADNNRTSTNMASIDKIWRLIVYIRCYFMMSVEL